MSSQRTGFVQLNAHNDYENDFVLINKCFAWVLYLFGFQIKFQEEPQLYSVLVLELELCSLTWSLMSKFKTGVWSMNWPINVLVQLESVYKVVFMLFTFWHEIKTLSLDCHRVSPPDCNRATERLEESQKVIELDIF